MNDREKRKEIFKNYKESIKRAKFAPFNKNALNLGNPVNGTKMDSNNDKITLSDEDFYLEFKIKKLEKKLQVCMIYATISLLLSFIAIIILVYR